MNRQHDTRDAQMVNQQALTLQAEPDGEGWGAETFTLTEVGEAEVAKHRGDLAPAPATPPATISAGAESTAVWMLRDGDQRTVAAVVEVTGSDGQTLGRWGYLDLQGDPHRATVRARAEELLARLMCGATCRGMCLTSVACELEPDLQAVAVSVDDHFDRDGYFIGRGAGFLPAGDEAETERRRQVCNDLLRATPEG